MTGGVRGASSIPRLLRSAAWVSLGHALPMVIGLFAIPVLMDRLGVDRFGMLGIIWAIAGYFSLFDLGLGRALTRSIAIHLGRGDPHAPADLLWTAIWLSAVLGSVGGGLLFSATPAITGALQLSPGLEREVEESFRYLAISLPFVIVSSGLVGILEAHHRFSRVACVRAPIGTLNFLLPLVLSYHSPILPTLTLGIICLRILSTLLFWNFAKEVEPFLGTPVALCRRLVRPLLAFGGWLTISNVVSPLMVYFDRFVIGALLGPAAVAVYIPPFEVLSRLQVLPQALMAPFFPAMVSAQAVDSRNGERLFAVAAWTNLLIMLVPLALLYLFSGELLGLWLGSQIGDEAAVVCRWLVAGWLVNMLARPAYTWLQSIGRADLTAKAHCVELPLFACILYVLVVEFGVVGAATAWAMRALVDTILLNELARRSSPQLAAFVPQIYAVIALLLLAMAGAVLVNGVVMRIVLLALLWVGSAMCGFQLWRRWRQSALA